ncbi:hypothetical protein HN51_023812 [Arachis hypogaea]
MLRDDDPSGAVFLRTNWQLQGLRFIFCMCYKYNLQVENASVLLLLAEIHKKSGNAVLGLPYALASLSFCRSSKSLCYSYSS